MGSFSLLCTVFFSCGEKDKAVIRYLYNEETIPTVKTYNDTMYISDSGRVQFKVMSHSMLLFDKAAEPYTLFPDTAYLEQYDSLMNVITTLRADSVWNYEKKKLWMLRGDVQIVNSDSARFNSEELFWDQEKDKIYSNLYVIIKEPNKAIIKAYGFESNQNMTEYTYRRATDAEFYIRETSDEESKSKE